MAVGPRLVKRGLTVLHVYNQSCVWGFVLSDITNDRKEAKPNFRVTFCNMYVCCCPENAEITIDRNFWSISVSNVISSNGVFKRVFLFFTLAMSSAKDTIHWPLDNVKSLISLFNLSSKLLQYCLLTLSVISSGEFTNTSLFFAQFHPFSPLFFGHLVFRNTLATASWLYTRSWLETRQL